MDINEAIIVTVDAANYMMDEKFCTEEMRKNYLGFFCMMKSIAPQFPEKPEIETMQQIGKVVERALSYDSSFVKEAGNGSIGDNIMTMIMSKHFINRLAEAEKYVTELIDKIPDQSDGGSNIG